jgi:hypothetical protein
MRWTILIAAGLLITGCAGRSTTTDALPAPVVNPVAADDREKLFDACERVARELHFTIARRDFRGGVLTTEPMTSAQFFEPWRRELRTASDVAESSLATVRRTLRFDITAQGGQFIATPTVTVERFAQTERRMTSSATYGSAFKRTTATGSRELDAGVSIPRAYWYETGKDADLAAYAADRVRDAIR